MSPDPVATYRLQLHPDFTLDHAAALAPYLARLGVSHIYTSPILESSPGSMHSYDVVDHSRVDSELGGVAAHARFVDALRSHGLSHLLDIVPNHMGTTLPANHWWWDLLKRGRASPHASAFDLHWDRLEGDGREFIVLPVLGDHLREVLARGELQLARDAGTLVIRYYESVFPVGQDTLGDDEQSDRALEAINKDPEALGRLLDRQCYRLAHWRLASESIGYRRFFDVHTLVGLRVEDPAVFEATHRLLLDLFARGAVAGFRIDHIDGLRDPQSYLDRLAAAAPGAWILVEKILERDEQLRSSWPVAGTTGYEFLNEVAGLFVDPAGEEAISELYASFTGMSTSYPDVAREKKLHILRGVLGADLQRMADMLLVLARRHRLDFTREEMLDTLREVLASFSVYRTYARAKTRTVHDDDIAHVDAAIEETRRRRPSLDEDILHFIRDLLLLRLEGPLVDDFVERFQQLTGPVMAKGVEDTAFYSFNRLISLNDVGGNPGRFGTSLEEFHSRCLERQEHWPYSLLATTTHDTKRGEDARTRISALSEIPAAWSEAVHRWAEMNERHREGAWPDPNAEYLFYQMLVGSWPLETGRAWRYMEKASREAKTHTSWRRHNPPYESALRAFVQGALNDAEFVEDLERFLAPLLPVARIASLSQTLIRMTAPGIPDIYQGSELWDTRLVDPDNRGPVDFELRTAMLAELDDTTAGRVLERMDDGLPKLWLIRQALRVRRDHARDFGREGEYRPCDIQGKRSGHVVAYRRGGSVVTVAPRLLLTLGGSWKDTSIRLPRGSWHNAFTGEDWSGDVPVKGLLARFPVALLTLRSPDSTPG